MPVDIIWRDRGVIYKATDVLSGAEMIQGNREMYDDSRWPNAHFQIVDLEDLEHADVSDDELAEAVALETEGSTLNPDARIIIVKPSHADESVSNLTKSWFMNVHSEVTFSIRFVENMEEADALLMK